MQFTIFCMVNDRTTFGYHAENSVVFHLFRDLVLGLDRFCHRCGVLILPQVSDKRAMAFVRNLEEQAPIDYEVGSAILALWEGKWLTSERYQVAFNKLSA